MSQERSATAPLYEVIHDVLREHIAERRLTRGLVLSESSIARAFCASRVPVRAALQRLRANGLVCDFNGRGYLVGSDGAPPVRMGLTEAGFRLPAHLKIRLSARNRWEHIYPEVEHAVAICLAYGRFMLNESSLAEYYAVSRTVAHEVLTKLERAGIVSRDQNQRWYAGPLTEKNVREHFEIRWLLEPVALSQAFPRLDLVKLGRKRDRVARIKDGLSSPDELERIERDLHIEAISQCDNALVLETVRRSQLPLFAAHTTFHQYQRRDDIKMMVSDHTRILDRLLSGQLDSASGMLEAHIKRSLEPCIEIWRRLGEIPEKMLPTYMVQVGQR